MQFQAELLNGSRAIVNKRDLSLLDLAALTTETGDEFAVFTRKGRRLVVRGGFMRVPITPDDAAALNAAGYKWSGHTHPGISDSVLTPSKGDVTILDIFKQNRTVIYNSIGKYIVINKEVQQYVEARK